MTQSLPADAGTLHYTARSFNRVCYVLAFLWVAVALQVSLKLHPIETPAREYHDFSQFYMGGLVARHDAWDALYPVPHAGSLNSPGEWEESDARPAYRRLADEAGVPERSSRYIQPPPFALALKPLAYLKYDRAKTAWRWLMALFTGGVAVLAGRTYEWSAGRRSRLAGCVALLVAVCPLTLEAQRLLNVTPLIALLIGFSVLGLMHRHSEGGGLALVIGAASKYATAILLPLYVAMRKWRALIFIALFSGPLIAGAYAVMGRGPFEAFFKEMVPTFGRVHTDAWNRSLPAVVMHAVQLTRHADKSVPLTGAGKWAVRVVQYGSLLGILAILFLKRAEFWRSAPNVFAAAAALLTWFLIFSPILWDHYFMYLMPLWGWLAWEARQSWAKALLVVLVIGFQCVPEGVLESAAVEHLRDRSRWVGFGLDSAMLVVAVIILGVGLWRLFTPLVASIVEGGETEGVDEADAPAAVRHGVPGNRAVFVDHRAHATTPRQFNRVCAAFALFWLAFIVPYSLHLPSRNNGSSLFGTLYQGDFPQFYMGGVMARLKAWDSLYPIPRPGSLNNPGMPEDSAMRPRYAAEAERRGVGDRLRFIQPPPVALLLIPLAFLSYSKAFAVWIALLILTGWGTAVVSGRILETLRGRRSKAAGFLTLLVATSPLMLHSIRVANMTVPVAFCVGLATLALVRRRPAAGGLAVTLGAVTKYATLALLPVAVAGRRWSVVFVAILVAAALFGGTYAVTKAEPFRTYAKEISPTLARTHGIETNQSLSAFLTRLGHQTGKLAVDQPLGTGLRWTVLGVEAVVLLLVLWLLFRKPATAYENPANVFAGAAAMLGILLIFSPIFWEHYATYLCPLWGWMLWEGWRAKAKLPLALIAIGATYVPWTYLKDWHEPRNSHMLLGAVAVLGMGVWTLFETGPVAVRVDDALTPSPGTPGEGGGGGVSYNRNVAPGAYEPEA